MFEVAFQHLLHTAPLCTSIRQHWPVEREASSIICLRPLVGQARNQARHDHSYSIGWDSLAWHPQSPRVAGAKESSLEGGGEIKFDGQFISL